MTLILTSLRRRFLKLRRSSRCFHSAVEYPLSHPIYTIWASNTSLGKTLVSAGLSMSFISSNSEPSSKKRFLYVKPLQTGFPEDSDSRFVYRKFCDFFARNPLVGSVFASNCVLKVSVPAARTVSENGFANEYLASEKVEKGGRFESGFVNLNLHEETKLQGSVFDENESYPESELVCLTMHAWKEAVSPHLAAENEGAAIKDSLLLQSLKTCMERASLGAEGSQAMCLIETAGGVASPGPNSSLQCDLYRPFRLPAVLVGDGRLGGISGTISAYETLKLRGYDVAAVIFEDHGLQNELPLSSYFHNRVPVLVLPCIPTDLSDNLADWFQKSQVVFNTLKEILISDFQKRIQLLNGMPERACAAFWWPFTQHKLVLDDKVTVIDSRCGENFSIHKEFDCISQQFDACASWWTQGPDASLQIELARDVGYATARYGHVMFPENVYEPSLELAELLLEGVGRGWASRVYFSDNGSTAVEIALKMAFRKYLVDSKLDLDLVNADWNHNFLELKVLALKGSYHGDTLGAMEAQAPSPYTGLLQQPWYCGRGVFLDPPTVGLCNGTWEVLLPKKMQSLKSKDELLAFSSLDDVFIRSRDSSTLSMLYSSVISEELQLLTDGSGRSQVGALIIEPVIHGAGGMLMIDPLYQRTLVRECKRRNIPVIFDEVFTGFWRLGRESAAEILDCQPDIACFAKLMTGGIIPLSATLASDAVFQAFEGDSKLQALLHGHSYTAHAIGCTAAVKSIKWFKDHKTNSNLIPGSQSLQELWNRELVLQLSWLPVVSRIVTLGTLCAIELTAEGSDAGYASTYAGPLLERLHRDGIYMRPLGNVIYLMCGPCTSPETCRGILDKVYDGVLWFGRERCAPPLCSADSKM